MGSQLVLVLLVLASGFVAAGLLNALHRLVVANEDDQARPLVLFFDTPASIFWSIIICVFAGPYLIVSSGLYFWRMEVLPAFGLTVCALLSLIWSFCSGIFIVEVVMMIARM